jgi:hypothetical protein
MHLKATILALAMVAGATAPAAAWTMIAQRNVTDRAETDEIALPGNRMFSRLRICVLRNPVHFIDVDVWFRNGDHQDLKVASRINAGECTRAIDFEGGQRNLDRVKLRYEETSRRRARATVRVFAE